MAKYSSIQESIDCYAMIGHLSRGLKKTTTDLRDWFQCAYFCLSSAKVHTPGSSFHSSLPVTYVVQDHNSLCLLLLGHASEEMSHQCVSLPAETRKS